MTFGSPHGSLFLTVKGKRLDFWMLRVGEFTEVSKAVLPAPLGPTRRKEGRVLVDVER